MKKTAFLWQSLVILLFISIFYSCKTGENDGIIHIDLYEALKNPSDFKLSDIVKDAEIIRLDTVADAYFGNAFGLTLTDNYICFACDQQKRVYLFSRDGKFIRHFGRVGKGPGEFVWPNAVSVSPDEKFIVVGDWQARKILLYEIGGKFIRERSLRKDTPGFTYSQIIFADNDNILVAIRRPGKLEKPYSSIINYDLELNVVSNILQKPIDNNASFKDLNYQSLGRRDNGYFFWETMMDTIYSFDLNGNERPEYIIDFKDKTGYNYENLDLSTFCMAINFLPDFIRIYTVINGENRIFMHSISNNETKVINHPIDCMIDNNTWITQSIPNDVYGVEPVYIERFNPEKNEAYSLIRPGWTAGSSDLDCIRNKRVTHPDIRDKYLEICENTMDDQQSAILILKLK